MIQSYYADNGRYAALDEEGKCIVDFLGGPSFYNWTLHERVYPLDSTDDKKKIPPGYVDISPGAVSWIGRYSEKDLTVYKDSNGLYYGLLHKNKVFLGFSKETAERYWKLILSEQVLTHPHCYLDDEFNVPSNAIIVDIGAAEGFFVIANIEKIKKAYIFETENYWVELLKKTYAPFGNKVEIIQGFVGDCPGNISLDEFFKDREKPVFLKLDVEGSELSVLQSAKRLLNDKSLPLQIACCTYHRQEDALMISTFFGNNFAKKYSNSYFWHMPDPQPPFLRHGVMRATKKPISV
jgi:hypothetical protein